MVTAADDSARKSSIINPYVDSRNGLYIEPYFLKRIKIKYLLAQYISNIHLYIQINNRVNPAVFLIVFKLVITAVNVISNKRSIFWMQTQDALSI